MFGYFLWLLVVSVVLVGRRLLVGGDGCLLLVVGCWLRFVCSALYVVLYFRWLVLLVGCGFVPILGRVLSSSARGLLVVVCVVVTCCVWLCVASWWFRFLCVVSALFLVMCQRLVVSTCLPCVVCRSLLVVGCCLLLVGGGLLVVSCWL